MTERIIVSISGASGAIYGIRALEMLHTLQLETHLILTSAAKVTIAQETDYKVSDVVGLASHSHDPRDIGASIASGSSYPAAQPSTRGWPGVSMSWESPSCRATA